MQKRGEELIVIVVATVLVAAFVGLSYLFISNSLSTGKTALKIAASRDMALAIDTMYAYPYDMELE